ncbi:unnamed protein product [marine sediment metagenome]|uniref:Uncharacterized protein n=1 Tax=marine sediment metagenome TaxID=412755 RepID=X0VV05_9ZZZZ
MSDRAYPHHAFAKDQNSAHREVARLKASGVESHFRKYFCGYEILFGSDYKPSLVGDPPGLRKKLSGFLNNLFQPSRGEPT